MKITTKQLIQIATIAAIYVVLTALFMGISFRTHQLRVSEMMVFLAYFNPLAVIGLTLGCFIANLLMSHMPVYDCIFGTLATLLSVSAISMTGKLFKRSKKGVLVAMIWPVLFNGVIVGTMLCYLGFASMEKGNRLVTLLITMATVGFEELMVVLMGVGVTYVVMDKYKKLLQQFMI